MRYPAPTAPNNLKELEDFAKQISRYQKGSARVREKLAKLKAAHRKVVQSVRIHEVLAVTSQKDAAEAYRNLEAAKQQMNEFEAQLQKKGKQFEENMYALEELKGGIAKQTDEVWDRITALQTSCQDWRFAHQLNSDVCSNARTHAYGAFYRWALVQPLLRIWMATDSQVHSTTYATAHYEGVYEQLMAHFEVKDSIEQFGEDHYAVYKETEDLVRTVKQATDERIARTELLDHVHATAARKLQRLVSSCQALQKEIDQRESLRFKLNGLMMELSNALETDLRAAFETCEAEATKPSSVTVADLHRAVQEGTLVDAVALGVDGEPLGAGEAEESGSAKKGRPGPKDATVANTALNAVSKLPLLVKPDQSRGNSAGGVQAAQQPDTPAEPDDNFNAPSPVARPPPPSLHDSVYAQLPQYDNSAIAYVRSFNAPKRTKTWKWCKASAKEAVRSAQAVYPVLSGPVDLVFPSEQEQEEGQNPMKPMAPGSPKTQNIPSFRRRAGHSSRNPAGGRMAASIDFFSRGRVSVGSAGMTPESLNLNMKAAGTAAEDANGGISPGSPTETMDEQRRRALKFMLSSRETHYDLMDREVVDAVTLLQMEQARAAAAARQHREAVAARQDGPPDAASEIDTHQYRTHQLLTDDYSGGRRDSNGTAGDSYNGSVGEEEYSLYVSLPDMAAHTALTARQAVRTMQRASAHITLETISKISQVLQEATSAAIATRAGTADVPHHRGGPGPTHRASPPHTPRHATQPSSPQPHRQPSVGLATVPSARSWLGPADDTLEAQTAQLLESAPIELQAQDLNERVATEFRAARESVEDWIETHVQCNYKNTKRSLVELISNLNMDLNVPLDHDDRARHGSDGDDSSVEAAIADLQSPTARPFTPSSAAAALSPGSMNMTLKGLLDASKSLIGSIQDNLREFSEKHKDHDNRISDDVTLHRRPHSAGVSSRPNSAVGMGGTGVAVLGKLNGGGAAAAGREERFFEDDGEDAVFDPNDYAFTRRSPSAGGAERSDSRPTSSSASPSRSAQLTAMLQSQQGHLSGPASWPTRRTQLNSMESIICGELFVVDFYWNPAKTCTELIAKYYVSKSKYRQCSFLVTPPMISDLTNTPRDLALHTLFHDTTKVTQAIIASLTNETIDEHFYVEIVRAYKHSSSGQGVGQGLGGSEFEPQWPLMVIEEMLHPKNITSRRGSISQLYRPPSSETPERRQSKQMVGARSDGSAAVGKREFEFLMHILTIRKKSGELLAYSFPTEHEIPPAEPLVVA